MNIKLMISIDNVDIVESSLVFGCPEGESKENVCNVILDASREAILKKYLKAPNHPKVEKY